MSSHITTDCESDSTCLGGGGITALGSNLAFTGNTTFLENMAVHTFHGVGGAIYASGNAVLSFNGINNFISNSADQGGVIYA